MLGEGRQWIIDSLVVLFNRSHYARNYEGPYTTRDGPGAHFRLRKVTPANPRPWSRPAAKRPGIYCIFQLVTSLSLAERYRARYQPSQPVHDILYVPVCRVPVAWSILNLEKHRAKPRFYMLLLTRSLLKQPQNIEANQSRLIEVLKACSIYPNAMIIWSAELKKYVWDRILTNVVFESERLMQNEHTRYGGVMSSTW